jgi:hypothetical protein
LRNAISDLSGPVHYVVQVEAAQDCRVFIHEHVKNAFPGLLLGQGLAISRREVLKEIVATIADRRSEVGPVRSLKNEDRCLMVRTKALQLTHHANLL